MNILIVGSGAREHAIAKALTKSNTHPTLFCCGQTANPGLLALTKAYWQGQMTEIKMMVSKAKEWSIDMAFIGPELPLEQGITDALEAIGIGVVGPKQKLAQLETSKAFTRDLMKKFHIPGAIAHQTFHSMIGVEDALQAFGEDAYVIKADGLMSGKGVKVGGEHLHSFAEAYSFCETLHHAGKSFLIEEKVVGQEFSLLAFCDGERCFSMPIVQDHKRAFINDIGPNTGGMGSYSDASHKLPFLTDEDINQAQKINEAMVMALRQECGAPYRGILYGSFMVTRQGLRLIEYNARFGDPEALNILALLESDLVCIMEALVHGRLTADLIQFKYLATVCKYAVPEGYPDDPLTHFPVDISRVKHQEYLYWGSVNEVDGMYYGTSGRTVAVVGVAETIAMAEKIAEEEIRRIQGPLYHRPDIGKPDLIQKRIHMMKELRNLPELVG